MAVLFARADRGQDGRPVDSLWPLWNVFDLAPEWPRSEFEPRLLHD